VGSRAGPGATSSGPSAGGIGSSVFRTARRSARAGFIEAVGVMVVVSHAARNARPSKPMISFMMKIKTSGRLLSLPLYQRIWQGLAALVPAARRSLALPIRSREDFIGRATLCGAAKQARFFSYKKRSMIGPSFLIVAAGHSFRSVIIALSTA